MFYCIEHDETKDTFPMRSFKSIVDTDPNNVPSLVQRMFPKLLVYGSSVNESVRTRRPLIWSAV